MAEYENIDFSALLADLKDNYELHKGHGACEKVILFSRKGIDVSVRREQSRYALYACSVYSNSYIVAAVHLPANPNAEAEQRKSVIRQLVGDISELEGELRHSNTIVIGDYNASPFDEELIQKDTFNAVLYKEIILRNEYAIVDRKRYRRFYNPMVHYISESNQNYGSFYYSNGMKSIYWYCYDQVIVRKPLIPFISYVEYCKAIKGKTLLANVAPNKRTSDHLPLIAKFERMV